MKASGLEMWLPQVSEGPLSLRFRDPSVQSGPVQSAFFVAVVPVLHPWFLEKALEKVLVFRGALRRPELDQSSGAGEVRCGRPWDSRVSEPGHFHPRCL